MGLSISIHVQLDEIDDERWEATWLTSLQLIEQFPAPLASLRVDERDTVRRKLYSTNCLFDVGTSSERWQITGDLASRRMAESYELPRHLRQLSHHASPNRSVGKDILWHSADSAAFGDIPGTPLWGNKTQGYPYHYAMLAIGILLENSFPKHAIVHGDINRTQAEQVRDWAAAILQRPLALPIITDHEQLWQRLRTLNAGDECTAIRRFLALIRDDQHAPWNALLMINPKPDIHALRTVFRAQLGQFTSLDQRGALELIKSIYEATGDLDLLIDWVCGQVDDVSSHVFPPDELLRTLCHEMLTIPLERRATIHEFIRAAFDPMQTIDTVFGRIAAVMAGMPVVIDAYCDPESLLSAFSRHWPDRTDEFQALIEQNTESALAKADKYNAQLDQVKATLSMRITTSESGNPNHFETPTSIPEGEFLLRLIADQRDDLRHRDQTARQWGNNFQAAIQETGWGDLEFKSARDLIEMLTQVTTRNHLILSESAWHSIEQASPSELRPLLLLAVHRNRDLNFSKYQVHILESPDLWHYLSAPKS